MEFQPIGLGSSERPRVVLPVPDPGVSDRIGAASTLNELARTVAAHPDSMDAWAALGERYERSEATLVAAVTAYACFRVGYHRGLDALRKKGWTGSQSVKWEDEPNRGFLRCVSGLARMAARLGELPEAQRCARFLIDLDPDWALSSRELPEPAAD